MNRKTILTSTILAAIAASALLAGCSSHSGQPAGVTHASVAHDPTVAYTQYQVNSQLAEGLYLAYFPETDIYDYYSSHSTLPSSVDQVKWTRTPNDPTFTDAGKYVGSVSVGPALGRITVRWARGALAGKSLVLAPVQVKRAPYLCWRVDSTTTVPAAALAAHGHITNECLESE